jgi:hypothetical protein
MRREPGGRHHQVKVRFSDEEFAAASARAAAAKISLARLLAEAALAGDAATASEKRAVVGELLAARRLAAAIGNNLNQLARVANSTGWVRPEVDGAAATAGRAVARLEAAARAIAERRIW